MSHSSLNTQPQQNQEELISEIKAFLHKNPPKKRLAPSQIDEILLTNSEIYLEIKKEKKFRRNKNFINSNLINLVSKYEKNIMKLSRSIPLANSFESETFEASKYYYQSLYKRKPIAPPTQPTRQQIPPATQIKPNFQKNINPANYEMHYPQNPPIGSNILLRNNISYAEYPQNQGKYISSQGFHQNQNGILKPMGQSFMTYTNNNQEYQQINNISSMNNMNNIGGISSLNNMRENMNTINNMNINNINTMNNMNNLNNMTTINNMTNINNMNNLNNISNINNISMNNMNNINNMSNMNNMSSMNNMNNMNNMGNITSMNTINNMGAMNNIGNMSNMGNINNMNTMNSINNMGNMNNMNTMGGMNNMGNLNNLNPNNSMGLINYGNMNYDPYQMMNPNSMMKNMNEDLMKKDDK